MVKRSYVSTGKAARVLGVTPDTVLKWIKRGRLFAIRTAGGHFRIPRENVDALAGPQASPAEDAGSRQQTYCWEYFADGALQPQCSECLVHRSRALRCYELRQYLKPAGNKLPCALQSACESCAYFQDQMRGPVRLLVVTESLELRQQLSEQAQHAPRFKIEFAAHGYDCSALVERMRPEYVLIDCAMPPELSAALCAHLSGDPRIAGVGLILTISAHARAPSPLPASVIGKVDHPVCLSALEQLINEGNSVRRTERSSSDQ